MDAMNVDWSYLAFAASPDAFDAGKTPRTMTVNAISHAVRHPERELGRQDQ